jgi:hypothetical protein
MVGGAGISGEVQLAMQRGSSFSMILAAASLRRAGLANAPADAEGRELAAGEGFYLAPHGSDAALIAWVRRPHPVAVVPLRGSPYWLPPVPQEKSRAMQPNAKGWYHWSAMPALSISNGIVVQTVTDLGSSQRQLLVRGRDGAVARMHELEGPIGFVGASPSGRILLAVLRDLTPVAVCYRVSQ